MNIVSAFADYLQSQDVATRGHDLFTSRAPSSKTLQATGNNPDRIFWLKSAGGPAPEKSVNGGGLQTYIVEVNHRDVSGDAVYDTLQSLSDTLSCSGCVSLTGYEVTEITTEGPWTDQDLDNEERTVGLLQVLITTRKEC